MSQATPHILGLFTPESQSYELLFRNPKPLVSERVEVTPEALRYLRRFDDSEGRQEVEFKIDLNYPAVVTRFGSAYAMLEDMRKACSADLFLVYVREAVKNTTRADGGPVMVLDYILSNTISAN